MKRILLIGTGGTIASLKSARGLSPMLQSSDILVHLPQLSTRCHIDTIQPFNLDSTNVGPEQWVIIAETIAAHYDQYDGFVILHGTDTLAYTASALSYLIQDADKPIVLTGAQKPIHVDITDAKTNVLDSFTFALADDVYGVHIVFDGKVIVGTRANKRRAKSYNAFSSINYPYPAVIQDGRLIRYFYTDKPTAPVRFYKQLHNSIYVLKLVPGISADVLPYLFARYDCVVIESFGVGGLPVQLMDAFRDMAIQWQDKGKLIVMTTQVANEGSDMTVYEVGLAAKEQFNLIEAYDMTLESTITKLMWLMGQQLPYEEVKRRFHQPIHHDTLFGSHN